MRPMARCKDERGRGGVFIASSGRAGRSRFRATASGSVALAILLVTATAALAHHPAEAILVEAPYVEDNRLIAFPPGNLAPDLAAADLAANPVSLGTLRGKVVILCFMNLACERCESEGKSLETAARAFPPDDLAVYLVGTDHAEAETYRQYLQERSIGLPILMDVEGEAVMRYAVAAVPTTYVINRKGEMAGVAIGALDWSQESVRAFLEETLKQ